MKLLKFAVLLLQHGSLRLSPVDYERRRKDILLTSDVTLPEVIQKKRGRMRSWFFRSRMGYAIGASLAYIKNAPSMNKMFFVSDNHKLVYIRILKCASTSILRPFLPLVIKNLSTDGLSDDQIDALAFYWQKSSLPRRSKVYTKFAVVRNPFQRIVSVFIDLFHSPDANFTYDAYWFGILRRDMTFPEFLKRIENIPTYLLGPHFSSQTYILRKSSARNEVLVFRMDKDHASFLEFLRQYNISLPHANKGGGDYDYRSYYDAESFDIVSRLFRDDISRFGYLEECAMLEQYLRSSQEKRIL